MGVIDEHIAVKKPTQKSLGGIVAGKRSKGNNDQEAAAAPTDNGDDDDGGEVQLRNKRGRSEQLNGQVRKSSWKILHTCYMIPAFDLREIDMNSESLEFVLFKVSNC